jgi:hypothetical protein
MLGTLHTHKYRFQTSFACRFRPMIWHDVERCRADRPTSRTDGAFSHPRVLALRVDTSAALIGV